MVYSVGSLPAGTIRITCTAGDYLGKSILLKLCTEWDFDRAQPAMSVPLANTGGDSTYLFRLTGQTDVIPFACWLSNDGTDVSEGTAGYNVITVQDQRTYLLTKIFTQNYLNKWTLENDEYFKDFTTPYLVTGVFTRMRFPAKGGEPGKRIAYFEFIRGGFTAT